MNFYFYIFPESKEITLRIDTDIALKFKKVNFLRFARLIDLNA